MLRTNEVPQALAPAGFAVRKWKYQAYDVNAKPLPDASGVVECSMMGTAHALASEELRRKGISWWGALDLEHA